MAAEIKITDVKERVCPYCHGTEPDLDAPSFCRDCGREMVNKDELDKLVDSE